MDKREAIETAYRKLPILEGKEDRLQELIDLLPRIRTEYEVPIWFKEIGRESCQKELDQVIKSTKQLIECLDGLHATTIKSLANAGFGKSLVSERFLLKELCVSLLEAAKQADVSNVAIVQGRGRPKHEDANMIGRLLAFHFQELTGKRPTITVCNNKAEGRFFVFVSSILSILEINAQPEPVARQAIELMKEASSSQLPTKGE